MVDIFGPLPIACMRLSIADHLIVDHAQLEARHSLSYMSNGPEPKSLIQTTGLLYNKRSCGHTSHGLSFISQ